MAKEQSVDMKDLLGDAFERSMDDNQEGMTYKKVRKKRKERGLLVIYPLYTNHNRPAGELKELVENPANRILKVK